MDEKFKKAILAGAVVGGMTVSVTGQVVHAETKDSNNQVKATEDAKQGTEKAPKKEDVQKNDSKKENIQKTDSKEEVAEKVDRQLKPEKKEEKKVVKHSVFEVIEDENGEVLAKKKTRTITEGNPIKWKDALEGLPYSLKVIKVNGKEVSNLPAMMGKEDLNVEYVAIKKKTKVTVQAILPNGDTKTILKESKTVGEGFDYSLDEFKNYKLDSCLVNGKSYDLNKLSELPKNYQATDLTIEYKYSKLPSMNSIVNLRGFVPPSPDNDGGFVPPSPEGRGGFVPPSPEGSGGFVPPSPISEIPHEEENKHEEATPKKLEGTSKITYTVETETGEEIKSSVLEKANGDFFDPIYNLGLSDLRKDYDFSKSKVIVNGVEEDLTYYNPSEVTSDLTVKVKLAYKVGKYTINFVDKDGRAISKQTVDGKPTDKVKLELPKGWQVSKSEKVFVRNDKNEIVLPKDKEISITLGKFITLPITINDSNGRTIKSIKVDEEVGDSFDLSQVVRDTMHCDVPKDSTYTSNGDQLPLEVWSTQLNVINENPIVVTLNLKPRNYTVKYVDYNGHVVDTKEFKNTYQGQEVILQTPKDYYNWGDNKEARNSWKDYLSDSLEEVRVAKKVNLHYLYKDDKGKVLYDKIKEVPVGAPLEVPSDLISPDTLSNYDFDETKVVFDGKPIDMSKPIKDVVYPSHNTTLEFTFKTVEENYVIKYVTEDGHEVGKSPEKVGYRGHHVDYKTDMPKGYKILGVEPEIIVKPWQNEYTVTVAKAYKATINIKDDSGEILATDVEDLAQGEPINTGNAFIDMNPVDTENINPEVMPKVFLDGKEITNLNQELLMPARDVKVDYVVERRKKTSDYTISATVNGVTKSEIVQLFKKSDTIDIEQELRNLFGDHHFNNIKVTIDGQDKDKAIYDCQDHTMNIVADYCLANTIKVEDSTGKVLSTEVVNGNFGDKFEFKQPKFDNLKYKLDYITIDGSPREMPNTFDKDHTIVVRLKENDRSTKTFRIVDETGKAIGEDTKLNDYVGAKCEYNIPNVDYKTLDYITVNGKNVDSIPSIFTDSDEMIVLHMRSEKGELTLRVVDEEGHIISQEVFQGNLGDKIVLPRYDTKKYVLVRTNEVPARLTKKEGTIDAIVVKRREATSITIKVVEYGTNKEILKPTTSKGDWGDPYTGGSPVFDTNKYELSSILVNGEEGQLPSEYGEHNTEVVYVLKPLVIVNTVHIIDDKGQKILEDQTYEGHPSAKWQNLPVSTLPREYKLVKILNSEGKEIKEFPKEFSDHSETFTVVGKLRDKTSITVRVVDSEGREVMQPFTQTNYETFPCMIQQPKWDTTRYSLEGITVNDVVAEVPTEFGNTDMTVVYHLKEHNGSITVEKSGINGEYLGPSVYMKGYVGQKVENITPITPTHYVLDRIEVDGVITDKLPTKFDERHHNIKFVYRVEDKHKIITVFEKEDGSKFHDSETIEGFSGDQANLRDIKDYIPEGWILKETKSSTGNIPSKFGDQDITVTYVIQSNEGNINWSIVDEKGEPLYDDTIHGTVGDKVTITPRFDSNEYSLDYVEVNGKKQANLPTTIEKGNTNVVVHLKHKEAYELEYIVYAPNGKDVLHRDTIKGYTPQSVLVPQETLRKLYDDHTHEIITNPRWEGQSEGIPKTFSRGHHTVTYNTRYKVFNFNVRVVDDKGHELWKESKKVTCEDKVTSDYRNHIPSNMRIVEDIKLPSTYDCDDTLTVKVAPKGQSKVSVKVVNENGDIVATSSVTGYEGDSVKLNIPTIEPKYEIVTADKTPQAFTKQDQTVTVRVRVKDAKITVKVIDNKGKVLGEKEYRGKMSESIPKINIEVPSQYQQDFITYNGTLTKNMPTNFEKQENVLEYHVTHKMESSITYRMVQEGTNKVIGQEVVRGLEGQSVADFKIQVPQGYEVIRVEGETPKTFEKGNKVITYHIQKTKVNTTIKVVGDDGKVLYTKTYESKPKQRITLETPKYDDSYLALTDFNNEMTSDYNDSEITINVRKKIKGTITVKAIDENGKEIHKPIVLSDYEGKTINFDANQLNMERPEKYELAKAPILPKTFDGQNHEFTYEYRIRETHINVVVKDTTGKVLSSTPYKGKVDDEFKFEIPKLPNNYKLVKEPTKIPKTFDGYTNEIVYTVSQKDKGTVSIEVIDEQGRTIANAYQDGYVGDKVTIAIPKYDTERYDLVEQANIPKTFKEGVDHIVVRVRKHPSKITIKFVNDKGDVIVAKTVDGFAGDTVHIKVPKLPKDSDTTEPVKTEMKFTREDQEITYTLKYKEQFRYVIRTTVDGKETLGETLDVGFPGNDLVVKELVYDHDKYDLEGLYLDGKKINELPKAHDNQNHDLEIRLKHAKGKIIQKVVSEDGKEISSNVIEGNVGDTPRILEPRVEKHMMICDTTKIPTEFTRKDQTIIYTIKKISKSAITLRVVDDRGATVSEQVFKDYPGVHITIENPRLDKAYSFQSLTVDGKEVHKFPTEFGYKDSLIIYHVKLNGTKVTVKVVNDKGTVLNKEEYTGRPGDALTLKAPTIGKDYDLIETLVNGQRSQLPKEYSKTDVNIVYRVKEKAKSVIIQKIVYDNEVATKINEVAGHKGETVKLTTPKLKEGYEIVKTLVNGKEGQTPSTMTEGTITIEYHAQRIEVKLTINVINEKGDIIAHKEYKGKPNSETKAVMPAIDPQYLVTNLMLNGKNGSIPSKFNYGDDTVTVTVKERDKSTITTVVKLDDKILSEHEDRNYDTLPSDNFKPNWNNDLFDLNYITVDNKVVDKLPTVHDAKDHSVVYHLKHKTSTVNVKVIDENGKVQYTKDYTVNRGDKFNLEKPTMDKKYDVIQESKAIAKVMNPTYELVYRVKEKAKTNIIVKVIDDEGKELYKKIYTDYDTFATKIEAPTIPRGYSLVSEGRIPSNFTNKDQEVITRVKANDTSINFKMVDSKGKELYRKTYTGRPEHSVKIDLPNVPKGYEKAIMLIDGKVVETLPTKFDWNNHQIILQVKEKNQATVVVNTIKDGVKSTKIYTGYVGDSLDLPKVEYSNDYDTTIKVNGVTGKLPKQFTKETQHVDIVQTRKQVSIRINVLNENDDVIATKVFEGKPTEKVKVTLPKLTEDYEYSSIPVMPSIFSYNDQTLTCNACKRHKGTITVKVMDGSKVLSTKEYKGYFGDDFSLDKVEIDPSYQIDYVSVNGEKDAKPPKQYSTKSAEIVYHVSHKTVSNTIVVKDNNGKELNKVVINGKVNEGFTMPSNLIDNSKYQIDHYEVDGQRVNSLPNKFSNKASNIVLFVKPVEATTEKPNQPKEEIKKDSSKESTKKDNPKKEADKGTSKGDTKKETPKKEVTKPKEETPKKETIKDTKQVQEKVNKKENTGEKPVENQKQEVTEKQTSKTVQETPKAGSEVKTITNDTTQTTKDETVKDVENTVTVNEKPVNGNNTDSTVHKEEVSSVEATSEEKIEQAKDSTNTGDSGVLGLFGLQGLACTVLAKLQFSKRRKRK